MVLFLQAVPVAGLQQAPAPRETLRDVTFFDAQRAWAVGDRGTVLRTLDGGRVWSECGTAMPLSTAQVQMDSRMQRVVDTVRTAAGTRDQPLPQSILKSVECRLNSVCFVDADHGWTAGGVCLPGGLDSRGVILVTSDGGGTWKPVPSAGFPYLHRISMGRDSRGDGWGQSGSQHQGGEYQTLDGGRSWSSIQAPGGGHEFVDGDRAGQGWVAVSVEGALHHGQGNRIDPAAVDHRARTVRRVRMLDAKHGWAVGDAGTVLATEDGGRSWQTPAFDPVTASLLAGFDFQALHVSAESVLFAGAPGTHLFRLDPRSGAVRSVPSGTLATLLDLEAHADGFAWAVGTDGTILHSADAGQSWSVQRGGRSDLAVLVVALDDPDAGWELLGRYADNERFACGIARLMLDRRSAHSSTRFAAAAERLGVLWSRDVPLWRSANDEPPDLDFARERLVSLIRQTRPQVVVCNQSAVRLPDGGQLDLHSLLDQAIRISAVAGSAAESGTHSATPWQVVRLATREEVMAGEWTMDDKAWLANLGRSAGDHSMISRALAGTTLLAPTRQRYRITHYSRARTGSTGEGLFQDLGTDSGRRLAKSPKTAGAATLADMNRAMQKSATLIQLADFDVQSPQDLQSWRLQVNQWASGPDEELSGVWLVQLAVAALERGRTALAAEALGFLAAGYPRHPLAPEAALWLARYVASAETKVVGDLSIRAWRPAGGARQPAPGSAPAGGASRVLMTAADGVQHLVWAPTTPGKITGSQIIDDRQVMQVSAVLAEEIGPLPGETAGDPAGTGAAAGREYWQAVAGRLTGLTSRYAGMGSNSQMMLAQANAVRQSAGFEKAATLYQSLLERRALEPAVGGIALREKQVSGGSWNGGSWICPQLPERPSLDGVLDDPAWSGLMKAGQMKMLSVSPGSGGNAVQTDYLMLAHDSEYLYLAGRMNRLQTVRPGQKTGLPRVRDGLAQSGEHVTLSFDLDRDGAWPLWLGIGADGQLADGIGNTRGWNPQWFVANGPQEPGVWTFEAAIAWRQLGLSGPPPAGEPWAVGLERYANGDIRSRWDVPGPGLTVLPLSPLQVPEAPVQRWQLLAFEIQPTVPDSPSGTGSGNE